MPAFGHLRGVILPKREAPAGGRRLRHEFKYIVDEGTYRVLRSRLSALMMPDPNGDNGEYRVTSIYFDDIYGSGYNDKLNGMLTRRKFRVRSYNLDPSLITLEAKHKDDCYVSKLTNRLTPEQYAVLIAGDCSFMSGSDSEEDAFGEFYRSDRISLLRPRVIVDYVRDALIYPFGNVRVTFDKKLSTCYNTIDMFSEEVFYSPVYEKDIILEVKYDDYIPEGIQAALQGLNAASQSVSKYVICSDRITEVRTYGF